MVPSSSGAFFSPLQTRKQQTSSSGIFWKIRRLPFFRKLQRIRELQILGILFIIVFSGFFFFVNAGLVRSTVQDRFSTGTVTTSSLQLVENQHFSAQIFNEKQQQLHELEAQLNDLQKVQKVEIPLANSIQDFLNKNTQQHPLPFNTLPPTNRLIIPSLNLDVPLINIVAKEGQDFAEGDFDKELMQGVVKYPTTPAPGDGGNTLLFGHSSSEWRKHNEYGFVFRNLPKLKVGERFQIVWEGKLFTYEMVERKIILPKNILEYYQTFHGIQDNYVTLMGCYPIGSDAKRIMVVAKEITENK